MDSILERKFALKSEISELRAELGVLAGPYVPSEYYYPLSGASIPEIPPLPETVIEQIEQIDKAIQRKEREWSNLRL